MLNWASQSGRGGLLKVSSSKSHRQQIKPHWYFSSLKRRLSIFHFSLWFSQSFLPLRPVHLEPKDLARQSRHFSKRQSLRSTTSARPWGNHANFARAFGDGDGPSYSAHDGEHLWMAEGLGKGGSSCLRCRWLRPSTSRRHSCSIFRITSSAWKER